MKALLFLSIFITSTVTAQIHDFYPNSTVWILYHNNNRLFPARSQTSIVFKNALINLVRGQRLYKNDVEDVAGFITYKITKINTSLPLTRNNGLKIYNGFRLDAMENIDNSQDVVSSFVFDIDSKSLFYIDLDKNICHLQFLPSSPDLDRCIRYCEFDH